MAILDLQALNPVYLDEANVADVNIAPPSGRWKAIHNLLDTDLNVLAPSNEIYKYTAEDAANRSTYHNPLNSGLLTEDQSILGSISTLALGLTASESTGGTSGTVTVSRTGGTFVGTVPSFNGIVTDGDGTITAAVVNGEGTLLEKGDVITFSYVNEAASDTGIVITITVAENDLQLGAGLNILKVTTMAVAVVVPTNTVCALPAFSQIQIQATDGGNNATVVAFFN